MNTKIMQLLCLLSIAISPAHLNGMDEKAEKPIAVQAPSGKTETTCDWCWGVVPSDAKERTIYIAKRKQALKKENEISSRLADQDLEGNSVSEGHSQASHITEKLLMRVSDEDLGSIREIVRREVPLADHLVKSLSISRSEEFDENSDEDSGKKLCTDV